MIVIASKITSVSIVCLAVCSCAHQRKHQSFASLGFVRGIHRWPVNSPHIGPITRILLHLMTSSFNCRGTHPVIRKLHYVFPDCVCMLFLFGWPPCQQSDMTLMEVSQRALDQLYIRYIWLLYVGVFLSTCYGICIYFGWINNVWVWVWVLNIFVY